MEKREPLPSYEDKILILFVFLPSGIFLGFAFDGHSHTPPPPYKSIAVRRKQATTANPKLIFSIHFSSWKV